MARISPLLLVPPAIFAAFAALALFGLERRNPDELPSAFLGRPAPALPAGSLPGLPPLTPAALTAGKVTVVNFWASWCPPCRAEHPTLKALAAEGVPVAGINFKDRAEDAQGYLAEEGNPFFALGFDPAGRSALDWGVAAPPETFILDGEGKVIFKFIGPMVGDDYEQRFRPALEAALAGRTPSP